MNSPSSKRYFVAHYRDWPGFHDLNAAHEAAHAAADLEPDQAKKAALHQAATDTYTAAVETCLAIHDHSWWSPDDPVTPDSLIYVVMHDPDNGVPHPAWVELPHILDAHTLVVPHVQKAASPELHSKFAAHLATPQDTALDLVLKLHKLNQLFRP